MDEKDFNSELYNIGITKDYFYRKGEYIYLTFLGASLLFMLTAYKQLNYELG